MACDRALARKLRRVAPPSVRLDLMSATWERTFLTIPLPHLGPTACLTARVAEGGVEVTFPGKEPVFVASGTSTALPGDGVTGPLTVNVTHALRSELLAAERAVDAFGRACEDESAEALSLAKRIIPWLTAHSEVLEAFDAASSAVRSCEDASEEALAWVQVALLARLYAYIAPGGEDAELIGALAAMDSALDAPGRWGAILALDEEHLDRLVGRDDEAFSPFRDLPRDPAAWWGADLGREA